MTHKIQFCCYAIPPTTGKTREYVLWDSLELLLRKYLRRFHPEHRFTTAWMHRITGTDPKYGDYQGISYTLLGPGQNRKFFIRYR